MSIDTLTDTQFVAGLMRGDRSYGNDEYAPEYAIGYEDGMAENSVYSYPG